MNSNAFNPEQFQADLLPGFQLIGLLGVGGMARVYLARDLRLERDVAIKLVAKLDAEQDREEEAKLLARLNHPNVVQIYDVVALPQYWAIVMEYVRGEPLELVITRNQADIKQRLLWALQIVQGLVAIHSAQIVHCDLSALNVMIDQHDNVKLLDFGVAHSTEGNSQSSYGNRHFSSPEQLKGQSLDHLSDYFSLGVLVYYLLTQNHPYGEPQEREQNILQGKHSVNLAPFKQLPLDLRRALTKLLRKHKIARPKNLNELELSLRHSINEQGAVEATTALSAAGGSGQNRYVWSACVFLVLVSVAIFITQKQGPKSLAKHILVSPAVVELVDERSVESKLELSGRLEHALDNFVIQQPNLALMSLDKQDASSAIDFAKQNGVNWILQPKAKCDLYLCSVEIALLSNEHQTKWQTVGKRVWTVNLSQMASFSLSVASNLPLLLTSLPELSQQLINIKEQQVEPSQTEFMGWYFALKYQGLTDNESWQKLASLLRQSEQSFSAYWLYRKLAINLYYDTQDPSYISQAIQQLRFAPDYYKASINYHIDKFELSMATGDYVAATAQLETIESLGASTNLLAELRARLLFSQGDFQLAAVEYEQALNNRNSLNLKHDLALAYFYNGELAKAEQQLKQILGLDPEHYLSLQLLGSLHLLNSELDASIEVYNQLIKLSKNSQVLNDLSVAYLLKGELQQAHQYAQYANELAQNNPAYLLNLADLNFLLGEQNEAVAQYKKVVALSDAQSHLVNRLISAQALAHLNQPEQAISLISEAKKQSPDNLEVLYSAALVYAIAGEHHSANIHVKEALKLGLGATWFNLPWFKSLCRESWFTNQLTELKHQGICYQA